MMEAMKLVREDRMNDRNPFREMLQRMGAFGGTTMQDMTAPQLGTPSGGNIEMKFRQLVQALIAKGLPPEVAVQKAMQLLGMGQPAQGQGPEGGVPGSPVGGPQSPSMGPMGPMAGFSGTPGE